MNHTEDFKRAAAIVSATSTIISNPDRWAKGVFACDRDDNDVEPGDTTAVRWCVLGAYTVACYSQDDDQFGISMLARDEMKNAASRAGYQSVPQCNDIGGHAAVMAMLADARSNLLDRAEMEAK